MSGESPPNDGRRVCIEAKPGLSACPGQRGPLRRAWGRPAIASGGRSAGMSVLHCGLTGPRRPDGAEGTAAGPDPPPAGLWWAGRVGAGGGVRRWPWGQVGARGRPPAGLVAGSRPGGGTAPRWPVGAGAAEGENGKTRGREKEEKRKRRGKRRGRRGEETGKKRGRKGEEGKRKRKKEKGRGREDQASGAQGGARGLGAPIPLNAWREPLTARAGPVVT